MGSVRAAFVMEQTLGHVTHYENLRSATLGQTDILPTWIPIPFDTSGLGRFVPGYRDNWSIRASLRARRSLSRELATRRHAAIYFHTQVAALFSRNLMRQVPTILSLDATPVNYDTVGAAYGHRVANGSWLDQRKFLLNRSAFHMARVLITWSEWAKASLVSDYGVPGERVRVIPPGASPLYFAIGSRRVERSADAPIKLLFVGGDFERKGGLVLLDSFRASRTRQTVELHIVTKRALPAPPGVMFHTGLKPNSTGLVRLFREADVLVLPSLGECLAVVLMEAAAAGLPIIATNVGAMAEAAISGRSAIVVPTADRAALRSAIEGLVDNAGLRCALGRAAFSLARGRFDAERNAQTILQLISAVARDAEGRGDSNDRTAA